MRYFDSGSFILLIAIILLALSIDGLQDEVKELQQHHQVEENSNEGNDE